ncbi:MAG: CotH kinase family protein [Clostridia bacterium]|nr:CotH kinase family protein [Clostridia bacterium]
MKRLSLAAGMAAMMLVMAAVVVFASPYAPVVQPCRDIEEIWAIEDARTESDTPLVTRLEYGGAALAYDYAEDTFYCALDLDALEDWPGIHLTAPDAPGVSLCFVDDYTYDWASDAVREGYPYQIIAYTNTEFCYLQVVFTGLPIVSIRADGDLRPHEDVPVRLEMSWDGTMGISTYARAHKRGDTTLRTKEKHGIKVEYTRGSNGKKKMQVDTPVLGTTDEFILIAGAMDQLLIRDRLSWDMWGELVDDDEPFGERETAYVEVFVNDRYQGVYLMMKPFDYAREMNLRHPDAAARDAIYRLAGGSVHEFDRPIAQDHRGYYYEQHYAPEGAVPFEALAPYYDLLETRSNAEFSGKAMRYLDLDSVIRYALFVQACGLCDNEHNNLYIWSHQTENGPQYVFAPWDLDVSWGLNDEENSDVWYPFPLFDRLIELDCGGVVRDRVREIWEDMRATAFNEEELGGRIEHYNHVLGDSGAFYRDAMRWGRPNSYPDGYSTYAYGVARFEMMDRRIEEFTGEALKGRQLELAGYTTFDRAPLEEAMQGEGAL